MGEHFLGLDSSTQSLTATIIDNDTNAIVYEKSVNFEERFGTKYGITNGTLTNANKNIVHSPPLMWVEALDTLLAIMKEDGVAFDEIRAVAGSGQQHGSVYVNEGFERYLAQLPGASSLLDNTEGMFSRATSPIWLDSSTEEECREIREALGGVKETVVATGSNTFARFTGPQIRKFFKQEPEAYRATKTIHLVSSFLASILRGAPAPMEPGDGAGLNLMNITTKDWDENALAATADNLKAKLPPIVASETVLGSLSPYFVKRYGFKEDTVVLPWSGDNPNALIGVGLIREGQQAYSLGTSDVIYTYMKTPVFNYEGKGHIFGAPTGDYMALLVFQNGSLSREEVRKAYSLSWDEYSARLAKTQPGNQGRIMLPYFSPEITPVITHPKVVRFGFDESDVDANVRGIIEAQMLASRIHTDWMGVTTDTIYATGGASKNREILTVLANAHNANVYTFEVSNSASLGAALRAAHAYFAEVKHAPVSWEDVIAGYVNVDEESVVKPDASAVAVYDELVEVYREKETEFLKGM